MPRTIESPHTLKKNNLIRAIQFLQLFDDNEEISFSKMASLGYPRNEVMDYVKYFASFQDQIAEDGEYFSIAIDNSTDSVSVFGNLPLAHTDLTEMDVLALILALEYAKTHKLQDPDTSARLLDRIISLSRGGSIYIRGLEVFHVGDFPGMKWIEILENHIDNFQHIQMTYYSLHSGQTTVRIIYPIRLYFNAGQWYLKAFQPGDRVDSSNGWKTFRLDRIKEIEPLENYFDLSELPESEKIDQLFIFPQNERVLTQTRFSSSTIPYIREHYPVNYVQSVSGQSIVLNMEVNGFPYYRSLILQYGPDAECLEPPAFREAIKDQLLKALRQLDKNPRGNSSELF
jgi:predicted DNA-binding transcriptional regulator YafY